MVRAQHDDGNDERDAARRRLAIQAGVIGVLVLIALVFVVQNSQPVEVDLLVSTRHPRLIWVILGCLAAGFVVGFWIGGPWRNHRRRKDR